MYGMMVVMIGRSVIVSAGLLGISMVTGCPSEDGLAFRMATESFGTGEGTTTSTGPAGSTGWSGSTSTGEPGGGSSDTLLPLDVPSETDGEEQPCGCPAAPRQDAAVCVYDLESCFDQNGVSPTEDPDDLDCQVVPNGTHDCPTWFVIPSDDQTHLPCASRRTTVAGNCFPQSSAASNGLYYCTGNTSGIVNCYEEALPDVEVRNDECPSSATAAACVAATCEVKYGDGDWQTIPCMSGQPCCHILEGGVGTHQWEWMSYDDCVADGSMPAPAICCQEQDDGVPPHQNGCT